MRQSLLISALTAGTLATATFTAVAPSQAFTLDINPNTSFSTNAAPYGAGSHTGASGTLDFTFSEFSPGRVLLDLLVTNTTGTTTGGAGATQSRLQRVLFDLPSFLTSYTYDNNGSTALPSISTNVGFAPFTNNPPPGYPGAGAAPNVRFDVDLFGEGRNSFLTAGQSTLVKLFFNTNATAKAVEGAFYWGFFNVDGNGYIPQEPLRAALRFTGIGGDINYVGARTESLLATAEAVPTPALLPALLGLGAGILRKKKQAEQEASA